MKKFVLSILLIFTLGACSRAETLDSPPNIHFDGDETITWDLVDGATHYIVRIDEHDSITVDTNTITLNTLPNGSYSVSVRAANKNVMSPYSPTQTVVINRDFEHPTVFSVEDNTLHWNDVQADAYEVKVNGDVFVQSTNQFDLATLDPNNSYTIRVKAIYALGESAYSPDYVYHFYTDVVDAYTARYNVNSTMSMPVYLSENYTLLEAHVGDETIPLDHFDLTDKTLYVDPDFLHTLGEGNHMLTLTTSDGLITMNIVIANDLKPYIVGNSSVSLFSFEGDVKIFVETFGEGIESISTNDGISSNDYHYEDYTLTLNRDYIDQLFSDNLEREMIFFVLVLPYEDTDTLITTIALSR